MLDNDLGQEGLYAKTVVSLLERRLTARPNSGDLVSMNQDELAFVTLTEEARQFAMEGLQLLLQGHDRDSSWEEANQTLSLLVVIGLVMKPVKRKPAVHSVCSKSSGARSRIRENSAEAPEFSRIRLRAPLLLEQTHSVQPLR